MADSAALSKAAAKNKKRAEKRRKERIQKVKENGGRVLEAMEMKDPVSILREQLQEAKNNQNHELAARLRQQLWIAQDSAAGVSMAEVEDLGGDISSLKDEDSAVINKTKTTSSNPPYSGDLSASGLTPAEKRLRALKKKLQQIENLKEKMEHGETLEKTQLDKITKEQELLEEIQEIESLLTGSAPLI